MLALAGAAGATLLASAGPAAALPSFAAQTGEECAACHVGGFGPQLTTHGRLFKLQGYGATASWSGGLNRKAVPLAAMAIANYVHTAGDLSEAPDHFKTNNNVALQEAALFLAGRLTSGVGAFVQATYSGIERHFGMDNVDIRFAKETKFNGKSLVVGATINNNPTVQDVFNTTPAWGFPYTSGDLAPARAAAPLIAGGLGQQVMGASGYLWFDDRFYLELGGYHSLGENLLHNLGVTKEVSLSGVSPYWRAAYSYTHGPATTTLGVFGMSAKVRPEATLPRTDHYTDLGLDGSYQLSMPGRRTISLNGSYIHERRKLDGSLFRGDAEKARGHLNTVNLDASYYWGSKYGVTAGVFNTTGSLDRDLYVREADFGSRTGGPGSAGYMLQADWTPFGQANSRWAPWANARLGVQYTGYTKFNGAKTNYDGFGRDAKDNNTLSVFLWTAF